MEESYLTKYCARFAASSFDSSSFSIAYLKCNISLGGPKPVYQMNIRDSAKRALSESEHPQSS